MICTYNYSDRYVCLSVGEPEGEGEGEGGEGKRKTSMYAQLLWKSE